MTIDELKIGGRNYVLDSNKYFASEGIFILDQADFDLQSLRGKTIVLSIDIELKNGIESTDLSNRLGYEPYINFADGSIMWCGCWHYLSEGGANFKGRKARIYTVPDKEIISINQNAVVQIRGEVAKVGRPQFEIGNIVTDWSPAPEDSAMLSDIPTSLPASDVYAWAKQTTKPSYRADEIFGLPTVTAGRGNPPTTGMKEGDIFIKIS